MKIQHTPPASPRLFRRGLFLSLIINAGLALGSLHAQTASVTINASSVVREIPAGLGGVCAASKFWTASNPNYRVDMEAAKIGTIRIIAYPADSSGGIGTLEELDTKVAQIINIGATPLFIQCIESETSNVALYNALLRLDGTPYPVGDTTPANQRVATNITYLVSRYKAAPFNLTTQYWEIGNEPDLALNYKVATPQEYIGFFSLAHNRLVASGVRGNVLLAGPVLSWDYGYDGTRDTFMRDFLTACASQVDIVTRHIYAAIYSWESIPYTPYTLLNNGKETLHFDSSILGGSGRGEGQLLAAMNARSVPTTVGTGVTEMNIFNNQDGSDWHFSITQGLWFLLADHYTLYNPRSLLTTSFIADVWDSGSQGSDLGFYNSSRARSYPYWAAYIHGVLTGDTVVSATSSDSKIVVTATKDASYLYVRVLNRDDVNSYNTTVTISNAPPVTAPTRFRLTATDTPDVGVATTYGTTFSEIFAPMTATIFRFPRTDAPTPPAPSNPTTVHLDTTFDSVPAGMLTYVTGSFTPVVASGRLQLTTATANIATSVVLNGQPLAAASSRVQARFGFQVMHPNAEGFVFGAYSANPGAVGGIGHALGYYGQNNRLWGVKVDNNPDQFGVMSGTTGATVDGWATQAIPAYSGLNMFVVVDYDGVAGTVRARLYQGTDDTGTLWADLTNRCGVPSSLAAGTVFGFTGSTGSFSQTTYIESLKVLVGDFVIGQEVILDNSDTTAQGVTRSSGWTSSTFTAGYYGTNYHHDGNAGKGSRTVTYVPTLTGTGLRDVYVRWTSETGRASNARYIVNYPGGSSTVLKDQRTGGGAWVKIGTWPFNAGSTGNVVISNTDTDGHVIADAVRFVNVAP